MSLESCDNTAKSCEVDFTLEAQSLEDNLIYPGAKISNGVSMLLIMTFSITRKLSGAAIKDLLSLVNIHCLLPHKLLQSLYKFKQLFSYLKTPLKNH